MASKIQKAVAWAIGIANDDSHGYDQAHRNGPDYDCSSFIGTALHDAGFNINPSVTTASMHDALTAIGFTVVDMDATRKIGDIFLVYNDKHHHVVMCINSRQIVHASINELGTVTGGQTGDQTGNEICIRNFYTPTGGWSYHFRAPDVAEDERLSWIHGNRYLSESEKQNNAKLTYDYLAARGWTLNAVAGTLGNFERESTINPGIWQNLDEGNTDLGYGLAQWTPATKYLEWAQTNNYSLVNGDYQLAFLCDETTARGYWVDRGYPLTFAQFQKSKDTPEYLALAFCYNYENAGVTADEERKANARKWYDYLKTYDVGSGSGGGTGGTIVPPSKGNLLDMIAATSYNLAQLSQAQLELLDSLSIYDRIILRATYDRNKRTYGTDFYGKRLHMVKSEYRINGVRPNGFVILQYANEQTVIYINPKYILKEVEYDDE